MGRKSIIMSVTMLGMGQYLYMATMLTQRPPLPDPPQNAATGVHGKAAVKVSLIHVMRTKAIRT